MGKLITLPYINMQTSLLLTKKQEFHYDTMTCETRKRHEKHAVLIKGSKGRQNNSDHTKMQDSWLHCRWKQRRKICPSSCTIFIFPRCRGKGYFPEEWGRSLSLFLLQSLIPHHSFHARPALLLLFLLPHVLQILLGFSE